MRILALNASPRRWDGNTHRLLEPFLRAARESGAEVRRYYVRDLEIAPCAGCRACGASDGCRLDDDMTWLLEEVRDCDVLVLGFPLYMGGTPGPLKTVVDRLRPLANSVGGPEYRGPFGLVMASVGGLSSVRGFDPCVAWFGGLCESLGAEFAGKLLRPQVHAWAALAPWSSRAACIVEALEDAGRELVETGAISPESEAIIAGPIADETGLPIGVPVIDRRLVRAMA